MDSMRAQGRSSRRNTRAVWGERLADYYGPALESRNVQDLPLEQFTGKAARPGQTPDQIVA